MLPVIRQEIRVRKWPLYIIAVFFLFIFCMIGYAGKIGEGAILPLIICLLLFGLIYYTLGKNKLIIDNEGITQELVFRKKRELKWDGIESSSICWHSHGHGGDIEWKFVGYRRNLVIHASMYLRKDLEFIADTLVMKCPQASIENRIKSMAIGKFPWYIF